MTDTVSPAVRSRIMTAIHSTWTKPEVRFRDFHVDAVRGEWLPYRPDFVWHGAPVYVESGFWHGDMKRRRWDGMPARWREHIFKNIVRDRCRDAFWSAVPVALHGRAGGPFSPVPEFPWYWGDTEETWL